MTVAQQTPPAQASQTPAHKPPRNGRWTGFRYLLMARLLELKREPEVVFWVFGFPVLLALGLGIAFRNKPADTTRVAIVAGPGAEDALSLLQRSPGSSSIRAAVAAEQDALQGFRLGKYDLVIVPDGKNGFQYRYDPSRPESVLSRAQIDDALQTAAGRKDPLPTSAVASSEPGSRYIDFLIPGLLGMNLMNSGMWGIGFALVDMRQRKLLKRFVGTPMRRSDFLMALTSSRLVLMVIEIALLLGFGVLVFHMRVLGSWFTILLLNTVGAVSFGGLGLLTASRAQKIESVSGLMNLVMMPMWIFSGVFFSSERFPAVLQPFIKLLPLTALNDALRATILQGASLAAQSGRLLVLVLWGGICFALALRWFRWT
jgi:ABC-type multidrug transport system permease subunit